MRDDSPRLRLFSNWFHVPWQVIVACFCLYWYWHPPAPNKAVLILTGVTVVMALLEMRASHKAVYLILVICLMSIENRAINRDRAEIAKAEEDHREEERQKFQVIADGINQAIQNGNTQFKTTLEAQQSSLARTMVGLKETVDAATGGDGFCYAILVPPEGNT